MTDIGIRRQTIQVPATDGFSLAACLHAAGERHRNVVIVSSATAVPQRFYRHFAASLARAGYSAVTYDYRGIGASRPASLRGFDAVMRDWALKDMAGILAWTRDELRPERIFMVGHSVGGQVPGLLENAGVDGMITVSAQSGHWRLHGGEQKWLNALHVHVTLPLLAHACGYMPWALLGSGEDLPKGVALEWSRWCRDPLYLLGDDTLPLQRFAEFDAPVLAYSIDDDKWGTVQAVNAMMSAYPTVERRHIVPAEYNLAQLGHFGYFRPQAEALWLDAVDWMNGI